MHEALEAMMPYIASQLAAGTRLHAIARHFVGAFHAVPGARAFRRHLAEHGTRSGAGLDVLRDAMACIGHRAVAEAAE
jgi:tRNA-dihydrouridine synthase A